MFNLTKREQIIIVAALVTVASCIGTVLLNLDKPEPIQINTGNIQPMQAQEQTLQQTLASDAQHQEETKKIVVDVKGQVQKPGIVILEDGKRVYDAIESAGGVKDKANLDAINLAAHLQDGQCIYIPEQGEEIENINIAQIQQPTAKSNSGKININTANEDELMKLPGIGPATAKKIIDFRNQHSNFQSVEDIMNVSGIGEKKFEQIKDLIDIY